MRILLEMLPPDVLQKLQGRMIRREWRHGDTIVFQGDPGGGIYYIQSGHVGVKVGTAYGDSVTVAVLGAGDSFGELSVLDPARGRTASVEALGPTVTSVLSERDFTEMRATHPAIDRALVDALARRVVDLGELLAQAVFETADRRCSRRVLQLAEAFAPESTDSATVPLTQGDLAGLTGATRPTVNQVLSRMAVAGVITPGRGRIEVPSIAALRAYVR